VLGVWVHAWKLRALPSFADAAADSPPRRKTNRRASSSSRASPPRTSWPRSATASGPPPSRATRASTGANRYVCVHTKTSHTHLTATNPSSPKPHHLNTQRLPRGGGAAHSTVLVLLCQRIAALLRRRHDGLPRRPARLPPRLAPGARARRVVLLLCDGMLMIFTVPQQKQTETHRWKGSFAVHVRETTGNRLGLIYPPPILPPPLITITMTMAVASGEGRAQRGPPPPAPPQQPGTN
jgi:hypothetical protein